jgi:uncharacterized membrane protein YcgQ (UPF0703/DUF1980 family)
MKRIYIVLLCCILALVSGCGQKSDDHAATPSNSSTSASESNPSPNATADTGTSSAESTLTPASPDEQYDEYPYDISADKAKFDFDNINIVVGDKLYMTQINDWYTNFADYDGKSVEIEGYYMIFGKYTLVGRKGPTCPYCTGGYVNFEFKTDEDISSLISEKSWVKVTGILRQGTMYPGSGEAPQPFYYIEAMKIEQMDQVGLDTVTD